MSKLNLVMSIAETVSPYSGFRPRLSIPCGNKYRPHYGKNAAARNKSKFSRASK